MHSVHSLYPYISIHILLTVLYIFTKELTRRTCLTITSHTIKEKQSVELKMRDQYQYLGNCPPTPTPPLTQQQSIDIGEGVGARGVLLSSLFPNW